MANEIVKRLGDWIFPQKLDHLLYLFSEDEIIKSIQDGLIMKSQSKVGANPYALRNVSGYVELTDKGWLLYETENNTPLERSTKNLDTV